MKGYNSGLRLGLRLGLVVCVAVLAGFVLPLGVRAQTRADTAAVLLNAAQELRAEGRHDAARAVLDLIRRRYEGTSAATSASTLLASYTTAPQEQRSGKVELTVWSTAYGIALGLGVPTMLESDAPEAYGAGLLAGAPLGFFAARSYLKTHPGITEGQARAITFGGTWGAWQGFGWSQVLGDHSVKYDCTFGPPGTPTRTCESEQDPSAKAVIASMIGGSVAGIATGALIARKPISAGVSSTVSASSLWGSWFGVAAGVLTDRENDALLATTLIGGDAAIIAAGILAPKWNPSVNRVRLVSLSGLVGGVAGGGLVLILQPDDEKLAIALPLATSVLGLALGSNATKDYDRDRAAQRSSGQGNTNALVRWEDGGVRVGTFAPAPMLRRDERGRRVRLQPAMGLQLFSMRF